MFNLASLSPKLFAPLLTIYYPRKRNFITLKITFKLLLQETNHEHDRMEPFEGN